VDLTRPELNGTPDESERSTDGASPAPYAATVDADVDVVGQFRRLAPALLDCATVAEVLDRVLDAVTRVVPVAAMASVTMRDDAGHYYTPVSTGGPAEEIDVVQYRSGRGPCVDAAREDGPASAVSDDLRHEERWPELAGTAVGHGFLSVAAVELLPDARPPRLPGALNVYASGPQAFGRADIDRLTILAGYASLALATTDAVSAAELKQAHLQTAIETRDVIGQAKGILMARRGLDADQAFDLLRRTSQDINVKLARLARTVAERPQDIDSL
jgi:hypothetical protein